MKKRLMHTLAWALVLPLCGTAASGKTAKVSTQVDLDELKSIYEEVSAGYAKLRKEVVRQPDGYLKYPYLIPAGFYSQLWDWDAFFMANHFLSRGESDYLKHWALIFASSIDEEGYVAGCMTKTGPRPIFGKFAMKPFLAQGMFLYSEKTGDYEWVRPLYDNLCRVLEYRKKTQFDAGRGLYFWEIAMQSGADNNPALNYFKEDSRRFDCADMCAFQYGELQAAAMLARKLGRTADAERFAGEARTLRENLNRWCWNDRDKCYYNVDRETGEQYPRISYSSFVPLMYRMAPTEADGEAMIRRHLLNDEEMRAAHGFRSLSKTDIDYNNKNIIVPFSNWQGPVWVISNYIYSIGLKHYGFEKEVAWQASRIGRLVVEDLRKWGTMHETYHADTGAPLAPSHDHVDKQGRFVGFISWNLCLENMLEGVLFDRWMLLGTDLYGE